MKKLNRSQFRTPPTIRMTEEVKKEVALKGPAWTLRAKYVAPSKYEPTFCDELRQRRQ